MNPPFADIASEVCGLRPRAWLCVGGGFAREEIKNALFEQGGGFVAEAVTAVPAICQRLLRVDAEKVLAASARQEALRLFLSIPALSARTPELKRLRRQANFWRRLDDALQAGRLAFAHEEEEAVLLARLEQSVGVNPVREEVRLLATAYEGWLEGKGLWDPPRLLREATRLLEEGWPAHLAKPERIWHFSAQASENRERAFWEAISRWTEVRRIGTGTSGEASGTQSTAPVWSWQRWHTFDDAVESLAEALAAEPPASWSRHVVLIPDQGALRRSLSRALEARGLPLAEPRDPGKLRNEEALKWALLPLELVARGYEREQVCAWIQHRPEGATVEDVARWVGEIQARGIRTGLQSYSGGVLVSLERELQALENVFGGKRRCEEFAEAHLALLQENAGVLRDDQRWVVPLLERAWSQFVSDLGHLDLGNRRAALLYWLERLKSRLEEAAPPPPPAKPAQGIRVLRLQQAPFGEGSGLKLWVLGLPSGWLSSEGEGDYWWSTRDRELLSEFGVRSSPQLREERLGVLRAWLERASDVTVLDAAYETDGRERESILPVLLETGVSIETLGEEPEERGAHSRWLHGFGAIRPVPPQAVRLPALAPEMTATALDRYSRCGFQALALQRWKLRDLREPDSELWADVRGNLLHQAVRALVASWDRENATFGISPAEALEQAWSKRPPKGLLRSPRAERVARRRVLRVLESFCESERAYRARAQVETIGLEDVKFRVEFGGVTITGEPDRIDEHSEGLFIIDYKTSSGLPNGTEMLENGYCLQLPFYALAAEKCLGQPALGVQFVELSRRGSRSSGVFFTRFNGKEPGKLTQLRSNVKSLFAEEPQTLWARFEEHVVAHARGYVEGRYAAHPKRKEKECRNCGVADLCGFRRKGEAGEEEGA